MDGGPCATCCSKLRGKAENETMKLPIYRRHAPRKRSTQQTYAAEVAPRPSWSGGDWIAGFRGRDSGQKQTQETGGLFRLLPRQFGPDIAGGRRRRGVVGQHFVGDRRDGPRLRGCIPVRERTGFNAEDDRLCRLVDPVRAEMRDHALNRGLVLVCRSLKPIFRREGRTAVPDDMQGIMAVGGEDQRTVGIGTETRHVGAVILDVVCEQQRPGSDDQILGGFLLGACAARHHSQSCYQCRNAKNIPSLHGSPPLRRVYALSSRSADRPRMFLRGIGGWIFPILGQLSTGGANWRRRRSAAGRIERSENRHRPVTWQRRPGFRCRSTRATTWLVAGGLPGLRLRNGIAHVP